MRLFIGTRITVLVLLVPPRRGRQRDMGGRPSHSCGHSTGGNGAPGLGDANREQDPIPSIVLRESVESVLGYRQYHVPRPEDAAYGALQPGRHRGTSTASPFINHGNLHQQLLRETIGLHTCDSRSSKTAIQAEYPEYIIEDGFAEEDPLYDPKLRESDTARDARLRDLLQDIFTHDTNTFISLTAHSGAITSILQVTGHRKFALATGAVIPVLVKVERVPGPLPKMHVDPPTTAPVCKN
jgi:hypothetical protein